MRRYLLVPAFLGILAFAFSTIAHAYLLSPVYVLKKMIARYHAVQGITVTQRLEAFGEDTTQPFASLDEKVEMHPLLPMKIWVEGKFLTPQSGLPPEMGPNRFLIEEQRRYAFYKDVFLNHDINLIKTLLERLGVTALREKLSLLYPQITYQVGNIDNDDFPCGIWIDKDRFVPLKLAGILQGQPNGASSQEEVEVHYGDYRLIRSHLWFPYEINFFVDKKLTLRIKVLSATLTTD